MGIALRLCTASLIVFLLVLTACSSPKLTDVNDSITQTIPPPAQDNATAVIPAQTTPATTTCTTDACKKEKAISALDAAACQEIVLGKVKNECYLAIGTASKDQPTCEKISDLTVRNKCYAAIGYVEQKKLATRNTFRATGKELCLENGLPIVRMYGLDTCPHCRWAAPAFYEVAKSYADKGIIKAHFWKLTGDDLMTPETEYALPQSEADFYLENDKDRIVPYFNFGCVYERGGTGYEGEDDGLLLEEEEMRQVMDKLIAKLINR